MRRLLLSALIPVLLPVLASAQTGSIEGEVVEEGTSSPIQGVNVGLEGTEYGDVTGPDGQFEINDVPAGTYELFASFVGYQRASREITVEAGETTPLTLRLAAAPVEMQEVEVIGRQASTYEADYSFVATKTATPLEWVPQSISVVTKEVLEDQQLYRLADAMKNMSGVNTFSGYNDYTIRGFRSFEGRLINGLKAGYSFWTQPLLPHIERIEVIKGPASALFGKTNPGGTINLVTKKPLPNEQRALDVTVGSFNTYRASTDFTGPLTDDRSILYRLNVGYENTDSFRDLQGSESYVVAPSVSFLPTEHTRVNVDLVYTDVDTKLDRGQPIFNQSDDLTSTPISFTLSQPGDFMRNQNLHLTISLQHAFTDWLRLNSSYMKFRYDHNLEEHRTSNVFLPDQPTVMQMGFIKRRQERVVDNVTNYLTADLQTGPVGHKLMAGLDYFRQLENRTQWGARGSDIFITADGDTVEGGNVPNFSLDDPTYTIEGRNSSRYEANWFSQSWLQHPNRSQTYGAYLQDQLRFGDRVRMLLSLRHEWYRDRTGGSKEELQTFKQSAWIPRAGLVGSVTPELNLYATYAGGFEPVAIWYLQSPDFYGGPFDPQTSQLLETGAKARLFGGQLRATASVYQITKTNVLVDDPDHPTQLVQRGEEQADGIELSLAGQPVPGWRITANYAYNVTKITETTNSEQLGDIKENAPKHQAGLWTTYTIPDGVLEGLGLGGGFHGMSERNTFVESLQLPGHVIADATLFYSINEVDIRANIKNLFDETYWTGGYSYGRLYPGPPRQLLLKVGYSF